MCCVNVKMLWLWCSVWMCFTKNRSRRYCTIHRSVCRMHRDEIWTETDFILRIICNESFLWFIGLKIVFRFATSISITYCTLHKLRRCHQHVNVRANEIIISTQIIIIISPKRHFFFTRLGLRTLGRAAEQCHTETLKTVGRDFYYSEYYLREQNFKLIRVKNIQPGTLMIIRKRFIR